MNCAVVNLPTDFEIHMEEIDTQTVEVPKPTERVGIYHADCFDGVAAAWVLLQQYPDIRLIAADYRDPVPTDLVGADVYIVDFSYTRQQLLELTIDCASVTLIDHHPRALEFRDWVHNLSSEDREVCSDYGYDLSRLMIFVDKNRSGAQLTWDYFHPHTGSREVCRHQIQIERVDCDCFPKGEPRPFWLDAVGQRDLWIFNSDVIKPLCYALGTLPLDPRIWQREFNRYENAGELHQHQMVIGRAIESKVQQDVERILSQTKRSIVLTDGTDYYDVPLLNVPRFLASEALDAIAEGHPFVAGYYDDGECRVFSLRSNKQSGIDTRPISRFYGGDGHDHASGFRIARSESLAQH